MQRKTVSMEYGKRAEKYIRQFSVKEIYRLFTLKHQDFTYGLTTFRKLVPKNLVKASLRDIKRNTCPLHENVKRSLKAFNRFIIRNKARSLTIPTSTLDVCLQLVCNPQPLDRDTSNRNPLKWNPTCTKGNCVDCGGIEWLEKLLDQTKKNL